jgi:hypothetical protein
VKWEWGKNIGLSVGDGQGLSAGETGAAKTEVAWTSGDGKARVFLTTWENDNPKSPIADVQWALDDPAATVIILGVTAEP